MGRTDEVAFLTECAAAWRAYGALVTFEPGWESRGNGYAGDYEGCVVHHTAVASSAIRPFPSRNLLIAGRSDLRGPLCNVAGPWCTESQPWLHVIAAYPANHAGASGGRATAPLPVAGLFNTRAVGLEIDYAGLVPMAAGQRKAGLIFGRGVCDVLGRSTEFCRAHAETSITGKWDPGQGNGITIDMAAFRRDAAALTRGQEWDEMASKEEVRTVIAEELDKIFRAPWNDNRANARRDGLLNRLAAVLENPGRKGNSLAAIAARLDADDVPPPAA